MDFKPNTPPTKQANILQEIKTKHSSKDLADFDMVLNTSEPLVNEEFNFIVGNWEMHAPFFEKDLETFQDIAAKRLFLQQQKESPFPGFKPLLDHAERINEHKGDKKEINCVIPRTDQIYQHYLKAQRNASSYVRGEDGVSRISLEDKVASCQDYKQFQSRDGRWQRILKKIGNKFRDSDGEDEKMMSEFITQIEHQRTPSLKCIACSPFFYSGFNIYVPDINQIPIIVLPSIAKIKQFQGRLKDEVCWLLNNNGGVILFDTITKYRDIIPIGMAISPKLKGEYEQKVISYIQDIYPLVNPENYTVTFVPIIKDPFRTHKKQERKKIMEASTYESSWNERDYVEQVYIMRIKVIPTIGERLYFWVNDSKPIFPLKKDNKITFTPGKFIRKMIKKRFKEYYVPQESQRRQQLLFMVPRLSYFHNGECLRPDFGVQVATENKVEKDHLQKEYPNMSILMAKKSEHEAIVKKLRERDVACTIQNKFQSYEFRYLASASVLYHKLRFDLLLNMIRYSKQFQFSGKYTIILKVTEFIKLDDRNAFNILPEIDFKYFEDYFNKEYPDNRPILWKYKNGNETEFYCKTESKSMNIFIFCIMNESKESISFKNPKNYDKLTPEDIKERFTLFYPLDLVAHEEELKASLKMDKGKQGKR